MNEGPEPLHLMITSRCATHEHPWDKHDQIVYLRLPPIGRDVYLSVQISYPVCPDVRLSPLIRHTFHSQIGPPIRSPNTLEPDQFLRDKTPLQAV
jgi:hypothetical protein